MPRKKRHCKTGGIVKFAQPDDDETTLKASYESRLREWRKTRDSLETEGSHLEALIFSNDRCGH